MYIKKITMLLQEENLPIDLQQINIKNDYIINVNNIDYKLFDEQELEKHLYDSLEKCINDNNFENFNTEDINNIIMFSINDYNRNMFVLNEIDNIVDNIDENDMNEIQKFNKDCNNIDELKDFLYKLPLKILLKITRGMTDDKDIIIFLKENIEFEDLESTLNKLIDNYIKKCDFHILGYQNSKYLGDNIYSFI